MKKCVFAGTFDPPTIGHKDIVLKSLEIFDEVVVALMINPNKKPLFSTENRLMLLKKVFDGFKNVKIVAHDGLLVDLLQQENTKFCVRGLRNTTDYNYENQLNYINTDMFKDMITVFLPTSQEYIHISSTLVKDALRFHKNVDRYVPEEIKDDINQLIKTEKS